MLRRRGRPRRSGATLWQRSETRADPTAHRRRRQGWSAASEQWQQQFLIAQPNRWTGADHYRPLNVTVYRGTCTSEKYYVSRAHFGLMSFRGKLRAQKGLWHRARALPLLLRLTNDDVDLAHYPVICKVETNSRLSQCSMKHPWSFVALQ